MKKKLLSFLLIAVFCCGIGSLALPTRALTVAFTPAETYRNSKYYAALQAVRLTGDQRTDIVNIALSQEGYRESDTLGDLSGTIQGEGDYTEYGRWFKPTQPNIAWCAIFINWCARQAGVPTSVITTSSFAAEGKLVPTYFAYSAKADIRPGDILHFKNSYGNHVGLVYKVDSENIYTIEGNCSDSVKKSYYKRSTGDAYYGHSEYISHYASPDYQTNRLDTDSGLKLTDTVAPKGNYATMSSFGLAGKFTANIPIVAVKAEILNTKGKAVQHYEISWSAKTYDIAKNGVDSHMIFGDLPPNAAYTYTVCALDLSGKTVSFSSEFSIGDLSKPVPASTLKLTDAVYPAGSYSKLSSFGLSGTFQSNYTITSVEAHILNAAGKAVQSFSIQWNSTKFDIAANGVDNCMIFGDLPQNAAYTYRISATDATGKTVKKESSFQIGTVVASKLTLRDAVAPEGVFPTMKFFGLSGIFESNQVITNVTGKILDENGKTVQIYSVNWNKTTFDIAKNGIDDNLIFGDLPTNACYTYQVTATDASGKIAELKTAFAIGQVTHTVIYRADSAAIVPPPQTKKYGTDLALSGTPVYPGYRFCGWDTDPAAEIAVYQVSDRYKTEKSIILYAVFERLCGDFDGDNAVGAADIVSLQQILLQGNDLPIADLNGDGCYDIRDLVRLKRSLVQ